MSFREWIALCRERHPIADPLAVLADAFSTVLGRYLSFLLVVCMPYLVLGVVGNFGVLAFPFVIIGSVVSGWGLLVYPPLLIGCFLYARSDASWRVLLVPCIVSVLDLWRVVSSFKK